MPEPVEHLLDQVLADVAHQPVLLQNLTADVEVEIRCVHHAFDEPEVFGHQFLAVVHDEDPLAVEVHAVLAFGLEQVEGRLGGKVQQHAVFGDPLEFHVDMVQRRVPVVADVLVEFLVLDPR
jgi:hypothetical protein